MDEMHEKNIRETAEETTPTQCIWGALIFSVAAGHPECACDVF